MAKLNQIQQKIGEMEGGAFQKLCDAYLHLRGYDPITPLGSLIGSDKVRQGTPDSLVPRPNGKFVFVEYTTTQRPNLMGKLLGDLGNCFDAEKTGVPIDQIEEIVICHTSMLDTGERFKLGEECRKRSVDFNEFGIGTIALDIFNKYPRLAREFLGIEPDSGQILMPAEFVTTYNKRSLSTPLDTAFHFRETEIERASSHLAHGDILTITGRPGVGKTRFALHCCEKFKGTHPEFEVLCILNRGIDLVRDIRDHLAGPGHRLLLIDDANRLSNFDYVLQFVRENSADRQIKIVATVRDYSLDQIRESMREYGGGLEIPLEKLSDDQIGKLLQLEFSIHNAHYIERINRIASGNPRLAIMAARIALREGTLGSLSDVSALYEEYFEAIRRDIKSIGQGDLLKTAGVIAFLRTLDKADSDAMALACSSFELNPSIFWEAVQQLHALEVVDICEGEIVRVSDQVLATYLFYLAFFREKVLDFSAILLNYFPQSSHRIIDAMNPVFDVFNEAKILEELRPHVDQAWQRLEQSGGWVFLKLMKLFWMVKETDTLLYIREQVVALDSQAVELQTIVRKPTRNTFEESLLGVLSVFHTAGPENVEIAIAITLDYLAKRPSEYPQVLHMLIEDYGFKYTSNFRGFYVERSIVDLVRQKAQEGENDLFSLLFLDISRHFLHTQFSGSESHDRRSITVIQFELCSSPPVTELRHVIWTGLFKLYDKPAFADAVLRVIADYHPFTQGDAAREIVTNDADEVRTFFQAHLDPLLFRHCHVVQGFFDMLEFQDVRIDETLRGKFNTEQYLLYELVSQNWMNRRAQTLGHQEYMKWKKREQDTYFASYDLVAFVQFFERCEEISNWLVEGEKARFIGGIVTVLFSLADRNPDLFASVVAWYVQQGNKLALSQGNAASLAAKLVSTVGIHKGRDILLKSEYPAKASWVYGYFLGLPPEVVSLREVEEIYSFFLDASPSDMPHQLNFLIRYRRVDKGIIVRVTRVLLQRAVDTPRLLEPLASLFHRGTETGTSFLELFDGEINLLKEVYLSLVARDCHTDSDGFALFQIMDIDSEFLLVYLRQLYAKHAWARLHSLDKLDMAALWRRDDWVMQITALIDFFHQRRWAGGNSWNPFKSFFLVRDDQVAEPTIVQRQDTLLKQLIEQHCRDARYIYVLFSAIRHFPTERRRTFISHFILHNKEFDAFRNLPVEPDSGSDWGSQVPLLINRVDFLESLLPLLRGVEYLQHRQFIEQSIQARRSSIEEEKRRDFICR